MWKRELVVLPRFLIKPAYLLNKLISKYLTFTKKHIITLLNLDRDVHNLMDNSKPHLQFTKEEMVRHISKSIS